MSISRLCHILVLFVFLVASFAIPHSLGAHFINFGEGPDELAHLDHTFFRFTRPNSSIRVGDGLYEPGVSSQGQGHQAPLYYEMSALLLRATLSSTIVGPFWDYQAGLKYSSFGEYMGGDRACNIRQSPTPSNSNEQEIRNAIVLLRSSNALLFSLSVLLTYLVGAQAFSSHRLALAAAVLYAGVPTAVWRSAFVTNDNLVACLGTASFLFSVRYLASGRLLSLVLGTIVAILAFWTKYTGIACLGPVLLACALRPEESLKLRARRMILVSLTFIAGIAPELLNNIQVEGDVLLGTVVAHAFPWLYMPSSLGHILFESQFIPEVLSRFWLEFHNLGILDTSFPLWISRAWWLLSLFATFGILVPLMRQRCSPYVSSRLPFLSLGALSGALAVVVYLATSFPLAGGRYLHTMLAVACTLVVAGFSSLLALVGLPQRLSSFITVLVAGGYSLFGMWTTYDYQIAKYEACRLPTSIDLDAGASFGAADIDGDGQDELYAYHRHPGRLYFMRLHKGTYKLDTSWSRALGLQGDLIKFGDLTGDGKEDVVIHRAALLGTFFVRADDILEHSVEWSYYSDRAIKIYGAWLPHPKLHRSSMLRIGNLDDKKGDELVLYNPVNVQWMVLKPIETPEGLTVTLISHMQFGGTRKIPFLLKTETSTLLGAYSEKQGLAYLGDLHDNSIRYSFELPENQDFIVINSAGDSTHELLTWNKANGEKVQPWSLFEEGGPAIVPPQ